MQGGNVIVFVLVLVSLSPITALRQHCMIINYSYEKREELIKLWGWSDPKWLTSRNYWFPLRYMSIFFSSIFARCACVLHIVHMRALRRYAVDWLPLTDVCINNNCLWKRWRRNIALGHVRHISLSLVNGRPCRKSSLTRHWCGQSTRLT